MTDKILYWAASGSALLAFVLFLSNATLINGNIDLQSQISNRQARINITASNVLPLNQQLSNAIYDASVKTNDDALKTLLISQGFTLPSKTDKANAPKVADDASKAKKTVPATPKEVE